MSSSLWRILFFGTDNFATNCLRFLNENRLSSSKSVVQSLDLVCSKSKKTHKRKLIEVDPPVYHFAIHNSIDVHDWSSLQLVYNQYDVGVVVSFGHMIPEHVIQSFPFGVLNIHASLLPKWRGASPIQHTILSGDSTAGITIMKIAPKRFDVGPVLKQESIEVPSRCTSSQLASQLSNLGSQALLDVLLDLPGHISRQRQQSLSGVSQAKKISKKMCIIDWKSQTRQDIDRLHRAIGEKMPLKTSWNGKTLKLLEFVDLDQMAEILDAGYFKNNTSSPGKSYYSKKHRALCIQCNDGWVGVKVVTLKSEKTMSSHDFYNGFLSKEMKKNISIVFQ